MTTTEQRDILLKEAAKLMADMVQNPHYIKTHVPLLQVCLVHLLGASGEHANNLLPEGSIVNVPSPIPNEDLHNHAFTGMLIGYRNGYAQVRDCDDNVFEIEPERLLLDMGL